MRLQPRRLCFSAFFLATFLASQLDAQTTTSGGLTGVVTDPSHAVVPDASVDIKDNAKAKTQSTKTDREGVYRFFFLPPSSYVLTVTHPGFQKESRAVNVLLGSLVTVNVKLDVATTSSEVTVFDEAPLLEAENGDVWATMNQKQVSEVPNPGNDLTYIAQTAPGVVMNTDSQNTGGIQNGAPNFSILGMPGSSYQFTLDGMSIMDNAQNLVMGGSLGLVLGQNQVEEATVVSTGYSAQFGDAAGGNINYLTKSGSNQFHGNAQYYWNGRVLNANDWFNRAQGNPRPFSIANQWAGSFGGPIRKSKLFFFVDTEGLRLLIPLVSTLVIPSTEFEQSTITNIDSRFGASSASDAFYKQVFTLYNSAPGAGSARPGGWDPLSDPTGCTGFVDPNNKSGPGHGNVPCARHYVTSIGRPSQDAFTAGRADWNLSQNDRVFFRLQGQHGLGAFYTDPISALFDADYNVTLWQGQLLQTYTFSSKAASQFLVAGTYHSYFWQLSHPSQGLATFPVLNFSAPGTFTNLGGANSLGSYGCRCIKWQVAEDVVKLRGGHKFGFGANLIRDIWQNPPDKVNAVGQLYPQTLDAFYQGGVDPVTPETDFTSLTQSFTLQPWVRTSFLAVDAYGQDEWHARKNLTITTGLRAEHRSNPECQNGCFARLTGPFESISHDPEEPYNDAILTNQNRALQNVDRILWSPRFSFAWQPFGLAHNSVLRGGIGVFYDPLRDGIVAEFFTNAPPYNSYTAFKDNLAPNQAPTNLFMDTKASNEAFVQGFGNGQNLSQIEQSVANFVPPAVSSAERTIHAAEYQRWSLEWQQALGKSTSVDAGYFGHHGIHELVSNPNANAYGFGSLPAGLCSHPVVLPCSDPRFGEVTQYQTSAVSNYNGLVLSFRRQLTGRGSGLVEVNYTYAHAFDEVSNGGFYSFTSGSSLSPQDPNNLRGAYGAAEYDVRHSLNANYVWEIPLKDAMGGKGPDFVVKGWQVSGAVFARTGFPYTVFDITEAFKLQESNYFGQIYAVPVSPLPSQPSCGEAAAVVLPSPKPCLPAQFAVLNDGSAAPNPNALFVQSGCERGFNSGRLGAAGVCDGPPVSFAQGRNHFRGPGFFNTDFAIMKNTKLPGWENAALGIGVQFFNLFNHPNFGFPDNSSSNMTFGEIFYLQQPPTSILGSGLQGDAAPRMIQLKAQLRF